MSVAQTHPSEPPVNLGDTSFLDALGGPGLLLEEIGDGYHAGNITDRTGSQMIGSPDVNSITEFTHAAWLTHRHLLGALFGTEVVLVSAHVDARPNSAVSGLGDITISPLILQWKQVKLGSVLLNQRFVLDFEAPTGEYNRDAANSLSSHAFTVHPYYAFTLFPTKSLETSWRTHYLYNGTNNTPAFGTGSSSTQAGQAIHFNATLSYSLPHGIWLGANGYFLTQITAPKVNGAALGESPEQVGAIGPGVLWDRGQYLLYANGYHEMGALNRPEGNRLVLRVQWILGRHPGIGDTN